MKVFDLSDDILEMIKDFVFEYRSKKVLEEFNHEWGVRRPYLTLFQIGRKLNVGRLFLNKDTRKMHIISFPQKCYIANILLHPIIVHRFDHDLHSHTKYGLKAYHTQNKVREKIHELCKKNHWDDLSEQTDQTIVRYLINKEGSRKYY